MGEQNRECDTAQHSPGAFFLKTQWQLFYRRGGRNATLPRIYLLNAEGFSFQLGVECGTGECPKRTQSSRVLNDIGVATKGVWPAVSGGFFICPPRLEEFQGTTTPEV